MKVCKFGGTSVGSVERMKNVANLISDDHPKIVVLSATAGTTDHLEKIVSYIFNREIDEAHNEITKLEFYFVDFANKLLKDDCIKRQAIDHILDRFRLLWNFTRNSFTVADEKEIVAQGELISTALMSFYLKEQKKSNVLLSAFDFMRIGPDGEPDMEYIEKHLSKLIKKYKGIPLFITQGFICKNAYNETDNLKRGGSDYTASLIGAAINAEEIQIWTDIDGMHNNDPRIVKNTTPIKKLSFEEAERLAYFGAKILHPFCIAPARQKDIPVRLLSSIEPQAEGTLISKSQDDRIIKAIAAKDSIFYLKFESNHALRPYLFTSKVFDTFARYQTSLCLLTSSSTDISIATDNNEALPRIIRELSKYANVTVEDHMSIISVVGNMKWQYTGFEAKIMEALKDIPLRMISYGSTNNDVSVVVKTSDKKKALQALSNSLFEDKMLV